MKIFQGSLYVLKVLIVCGQDLLEPFQAVRPQYSNMHNVDE